MINKIHTMLAAQATWYDIYEEQNTITPIQFRNNRFYAATSRASAGFGIRVNRDGRTGLSFCNAPSDLAAAAERALALAVHGEPEEYLLPSPVSVEQRNIDTVILPDTIKLRSMAEQAVASVLEEFPDALCDASASSARSARRLVNSSDVDYRDASTYVSFSLNVTRTGEDGNRTAIGESAAHPGGFDHLWIINRVKTYHRLAATVVPVTGGRMPVIFTPSAFSSLLSILMGQFTAVTHYRKVSPFAGRIGERLFSKRLSITDNPLRPGSVYSFPFDDEGVAARTKHIIRHGVAEGLIADLRYGALMGIAPTGNASRSISSLPSASFSNIEIEPGTDNYETLLSSVPSGIVVDQMLGLGQSNTITGDFSCNLDLAFRFESGAITGRVKNCMLSGNIYRILENDFILGADIEQNGNIFCPHILIPAMDVSV
jgi:PmbA protein